MQLAVKSWSCKQRCNVNDGFDYIGRVTTNIAELQGSKAYVAHLGAAYSTGDVKSGVIPASGRTESRTNSGWFTGSALSGILQELVKD
jgi:hypothetical protein